MVAVEPTKDGYVLMQDITLAGVTVPKGFKTNGADIPRVFWSLFPPFKPHYLPAIIVHDFLCDTAVTHADHVAADKKLLEAMKLLLATTFARYSYYYGCRLYHYLKYGLKEKAIECYKILQEHLSK